MSKGGLVHVLTGTRGAGKSTVCARVTREACDMGLVVAGVLTERGVADDPTDARWVFDLRSGNRHLFGSRSASCGRPDMRDSAPECGADVPGDSDPLTPGWDLDSEIFEWVTGVLVRSTPCDLLVIDEVGPLELVGGRGWVAALDILRSRAYRVAVVVCRPSLVDELERQLGMMPLTVFEVTPEVRDYLPTSILSAVLAATRGNANRGNANAGKP